MKRDRNPTDATPAQRAFDGLIAYLEAMTDLEPNLPAEERQELQMWYRSPRFTRDSDWPGWKKYLGSRPDAHRILQPFGRRRSA
jgi:hypothetical protein